MAFLHAGAGQSPSLNPGFPSKTGHRTQAPFARQMDSTTDFPAMPVPALWLQTGL